MKIKYYLLLIMLSLGSNFLFAQHENDTWLFGNNKWKFDNSTQNGFTHTTNLNPYIRYVSSVISDKNTGDLLFYSDGYKVYNKNGMVMSNGDNMFGTNNTAFNTFGNPSDQSSIIVPLPNSNSIYYLFYINGNKKIDDQGSNSDITSYNYGLRYAIIDMSLSGGLGSVVSKNNILFTNSPTNALTSTIASNNSSYWIVSANNGNFLSFRLTSNGLITTPVSSPAPHYGNFFKISPDSKKLLTRINLDLNNKGIYLADFNNTTGSITNQNNILSIYQGQYIDRSDSANSAEFSENSNVIYFISSDLCLCIPPSATSHINTYNISTDTFYGYPMPGGPTGSLQRAVNGKIYMIQNFKTSYNSDGIREVIFGWSNVNGNYSYGWLSFDNPNNSNLSYATLSPQVINTQNGYSFPQLVPHLDYVNTCPNDLDINYQITSSQNFQAGQSITASSTIDDGLTVNYKAGNNVTLLPGFHVKATENSLFHAYIGRCDGIITNFDRNSNTSVNSIFKETKEQISNLKISPNPASIFINIDSGNEKITSWELFDISGKNVLKGSSTQVNVQGLPKAAYLLKININNKITTKKVIVK